MKPWLQTVRIGERTLTIETGELARQANGAVLLRCGSAAMLATVVAEAEAKDVDFLPLTVLYQVRMAAAGRIPGSYFRREGRSTEEEILISRVVDRTLRPLFADEYHYDTQIMVTLLSHDPYVDESSMAILAAAAAMEVSDLPFGGPVGGLRVGHEAGRWSFLNGRLARARCDLDFVISAREAGIVMAEGSAKEIPEELALEAFSRVQDVLGAWFQAMRELRAAGKERRALEATAVPAAEQKELEDGWRASGRAVLETALEVPEKKARGKARKSALSALLKGIEEAQRDRAKQVLEELEVSLVRERVIAGKRLDGRGPRDIRPISGKVSWLGTPHGSALFTRGETQAMVTCTLGADRDAQLIEGPDGSSQQRFLLHYNFPPFSVGEVRPLRGPGRREIGHGFLAWNAILGLLPSNESFPYTIRVDSIISESNGSSSMATVCGGCLALMDAGVPLLRPVAGIAMGLVTSGADMEVISDILGDEDHLGDMDFKVAGTELGITAIQLDNKLGSLPDGVMSRGFAQAREGRMHILAEMAKILVGPRAEMSNRVPRAYNKQISVNRVRSLIGSGGKNIRRVESDSGCQVSVDNDGMVKIFAPDEASLQKAMAIVEDLTGLPKVGEIYTARVTSIKAFGCFVRVFEDIEGLVSAEQLGSKNVQNGETLRVKVTGADDKGRLNLLLA
jgi:polyribonucleotide nucleotidyltransferase